jgi:hypothetical protein
VDLLLYHAVLPENHEYFVPIEDLLTNGISYLTKSNFRYSNGGLVKKELTEHCRPNNAPNWINFQKAIGVDITKRFSKSLCFPIFTEKIVVFDCDVSVFIYDQAFYDDFKDTDEEALNFDTGNNINYWIKKYWDSMMDIEQYLVKRPYKNPEILLFENVPKEILKVCE